MITTVLPGSGTPSGPGSAKVRRRPTRRWWVAAVAALLVAATVVAVVLIRAAGGVPSVTVRAPDGTLIAQVPLDGDRFSVGYRNSIYRTLAEERYRVRPDGRFELVQIAAQQVAVLEEYYAVPGAPWRAPAGDRLNWLVDPDPAHPAVFRSLRIAADDLGERTLFVPGHAPVPLWKLVVTDDPSVILDIEEN